MKFMKKVVFLIPVLSFVLLMNACKDKSFKETEDGLAYVFHKETGEEKPSIDNYVKVDYTYRYPQDSVFYSTVDAGNPAIARIVPSDYPGDIFDALRMMSKGDSATFRFDAERFFTITMGHPTVPEFVDPQDSLYVDMVLLDFFNQEEYEAYMQEQREERMQQQEEARLDEERILEQYLQEENIMNQPEESGLIIVVEEEGDGALPEPGDKVAIHYTGMLLDGTEFDSSINRGKPLEFTLGRGEVIRGWDEGISKLRVGSKARLIIPSYLAYGDRQVGDVIEPYSTLVFNIEVVGIE